MAASRFGRLAILLALACVSAGCDQKVDGLVLEDTDYRFRITSPGPEWRLLPEADARRLVPDAIAGCSNFAGGKNLTIAVVLVEEVSDGNLDGMVDVVRSTMAGGMRLSEVESLTYLDLPARRWSTNGTINGATGTGRHLVFLHAGHLYQLVAFGSTREVVGPPDFDALPNHFALLPGPVRGRRSSPTPVDSAGVGWRLRDGVYRDAANGIEVRPPKGWRVAIGDELRAMDEDACVGLCTSSPDAYVTVLVERARGVDPDAFLAQLREEALAFGERVGEPVARVIGTRRFLMQAHRSASLPSEVIHGVRWDDGRVVRVLAWYLESAAKRARPSVETALRSIRFLSEAERSELARSLERERDPQEVVMPRASIRGGTFRDFEHGLVWRKPPGFWTASLRGEAASEEAETVLFAEEVAEGLFLSVSARPRDGTPHAEIHRALVASMDADEALGEPRTLDLAGGTALQTELRQSGAAASYRSLLVSTVAAGRVWRIVLWGIEGNVLAARPRLDAALRGLRFEESLEAQVTTEDALEDRRLGFRLRKPAGGTWRHPARGRRDAPGSIVGFSEGSGVVLVGAFPMREGQDLDLVRDMVVETLVGVNKVRGTPGPTTDTTLAGHPARRTEFTGTGRQVTWTTQRGRIVFVLVAAGKSDTPLLEQAPELFEFLE